MEDTDSYGQGLISVHVFSLFVSIFLNVSFSLSLSLSLSPLFLLTPNQEACSVHETPQASHSHTRLLSGLLYGTSTATPRSRSLWPLHFHAFPKKVNISLGQRSVDAIPTWIVVDSAHQAAGFTPACMELQGNHSLRSEFTPAPPVEPGCWLPGTCRFFERFIRSPWQRKWRKKVSRMKKKTTCPRRSVSEIDEDAFNCSHEDAFQCVKFPNVKSVKKCSPGQLSQTPESTPCVPRFIASSNTYKSSVEPPGLRLDRAMMFVLSSLPDLFVPCFLHFPGSYSDSAGIKLLRQDVCDYLNERDKGDVTTDTVFLCAGASAGIRVCVMCIVSSLIYPYSIIFFSFYHFMLFSQIFFSEEIFFVHFGFGM